MTQDKNQVRSYDKKERVVQPQAVIERIGELTKGTLLSSQTLDNTKCGQLNTILTKMSAKLVTSGGLGTMGFGVPAAIGRKIANPDKESCSLCRRWWFPNDQPRIGDLKYL